MQHAQSRTWSRRWIGRGALVALAGAAVFGVSPVLPALAASWSSPVGLPGSCGSSVAVNQAGAMAAGGTFTASDGTTHVQVCTSSNGKTWQATDLGQGGNTPSSGHRIAVTVTPAGQTVAVWGYWPCSTCTAVLEAAVHPAGGSWGAPVTLSTGLGLDESDGGLVIGTDGAGNVIAGWSTNPGDVTDAVLRAGSSWGPATTLSIEGSVGPAHSLSLAVNSGGSAIITFNGGLNNLWAVSGTVTGGFSAPVMLASGAGSNHYNPIGTSEVALNNAGQASVAWSVLDGQTGVLTRSPSGAWTDTVLTTRTAPAITVSTAIDGAGNAIAVFGSSYTWDLAGGSWKTPASLPSGSSGGLAVADQAGTFVYADTTGNAFTFTAGATSFGTGSGSHTSLGDLKIVPGQAVMLAADAVSAEPVS
ncbi:MAG: hypothetical protein WAL72_08455 [Streptosporangiaceae bacterium]